MELKKIIDPIDSGLLKAELTADKRIGYTNKGGNELYDITWKDAPNTLLEIGRLRELTYRDAGASSGKEADLDEYDYMENPYHQLIVWDPEAQAIIGGYRYIIGPDIKLDGKGQPVITSAHLYHYSDEFIEHFLPHVMELGRSFVTPEYQSSKAGTKSIFTMDNLWDGIASVILEHPGIIYFLGKMTIYPSYNRNARDLIIHFLNKHFQDKDELVRPYKPIETSDSPRLMNIILKEDDLKKDYRLLKDAVRKLGTNIPPLVNSYINTSSSMKMLGSTVNDELGDAIETGIMIRFDEIYNEKLERHMEAFIRNRLVKLRNRFPQLSKNAEQVLREHIQKSRAKAFRKFQHKRLSSKQSPELDFR